MIKMRCLIVCWAKHGAVRTNNIASNLHFLMLPFLRQRVSKIIDLAMTRVLRHLMSGGQLRCVQINHSGPSAPVDSWGDIPAAMCRISLLHLHYCTVNETAGEDCWIPLIEPVTTMVYIPAGVPELPPGVGEALLPPPHAAPSINTTSTKKNRHRLKSFRESGPPSPTSRTAGISKLPANSIDICPLFGDCSAD